LIGDSHAGHISQAVIDAAQGVGWTSVIWTHGGCHVQFQRTFGEEVSDNCLNSNLEMLNWVEKYTPDAIIVSQYVKSDSSQIDLRDGLRQLRDLVPNILLIGNNPVFPDGEDFMVQRPIVMTPYKPAKYFDVSNMELVDIHSSTLLLNWASQAKIETLDLSSIFCSTTKCSRYSSDWLYRDDDHFSIFGAKLTMPLFKSYLENLDSVRD
jgi:hypothetical protein